MNEAKINELLDSLFKLKYDWKSSGSSYTSDVVNKEGRIVVEQIIRKFLLEDRDEKNGILEAKIFMYEEIISKSNFAPLLPQSKKASAEKRENNDKPEPLVNDEP